MLLPGTYHLFLQLRLSKADRSQTKSLLHLSESWARNKEQVTFLKKARDNNLFPATISNIQLPSFFNEECMKGSKLFIKKYILKKIIRYLNGRIVKTKKKMTEALNNQPTMSRKHCGYAPRLKKHSKYPKRITRNALRRNSISYRRRSRSRSRRPCVNVITTKLW